MFAKDISVTKTLSLNLECLKILNELTEKTKVNKSKLVRIFIKYFYENYNELEETIRGG